MIRKLAVGLLCAASTFVHPSRAMAQSATQPSGQTLRVQGGSYRLFARAYTSKDAGAHPVLVVVLHGDGPPPYEHPSYQYQFAFRAAAMSREVVVVALLRPGYSDPQGNRSDGDSGQRDGDNWNARNTDAIAEAIGELQRRYGARAVVVAGHSGGAAITANMLGRHPQLIDAALLVSCPCGDVAEWRQSMLRLTGYPVFRRKVETLSPLDQVEHISDRADITMMVGTGDKVAPLEFSEQYQRAVSKLGKTVKLIQLDGQPHDTFIYPAVFTELAAIVSRVQAHRDHEAR